MNTKNKIPQMMYVLPYHCHNLPKIRNGILERFYSLTDTDSSNMVCSKSRMLAYGFKHYMLEFIAHYIRNIFIIF